MVIKKVYKISLATFDICNSVPKSKITFTVTFTYYIYFVSFSQINHFFCFSWKVLPWSFWNINLQQIFSPFQHQYHKMVKHTQTFCWQIAGELFECVWPFCGIGAYRVNSIASDMIDNYEESFINILIFRLNGLS